MEPAEIKQRFIEAADIESRMDPGATCGPRSPRTAWPVTAREQADVDAQFAMEDDIKVQIPVTRPERTKHAEVMRWLRELVGEADRKFIWRWATAASLGAVDEYVREARLNPAETVNRVDLVIRGVATKLQPATTSRTPHLASIAGQRPPDQVEIRHQPELRPSFPRRPIAR